MPRLTKEQREEVVNAYAAGVSSVKIGTDFGLSTVAVLGLVRRRGIPIKSRREAARTHSLNREFFSEINTEGKAYWLGFLLADGCVDDRQLTLRLAEKDRGHIENFRSAIGASHKITTVAMFDPPRNGVQFSVKCPETLAYLAALGIVRNKSFTAVPPELPSEMLPHFWRGVFDGDGCISIPSHSVAQNYRIRLYGSEETCLAFSQWVGSTCGLSIVVKPHKSIFVAGVCGLPSSTLISNTLYKDSTVFLPRKMEQAKKLKSLETQVIQTPRLTSRQRPPCHAAYRSVR